MPTIFAACSNRKRLSPAPGLRATELPCGPLDAIACEWVARLAKSDTRMSAGTLYYGRAFHEATKAARALAGKLFIVSAGLGVLGSDVPVPGYSLTVSSSSPQCVLRRAEEICSPPDWWHHLTALSPFGSSFRLRLSKCGAGLVLLALPSSYVEMLSHELIDLSESEFERIRIFTRGTLDRVPARIRALVMPYDGRFDGPGSPLRGTLADFAQRAARHFAEVILPSSPHGGVDEHRKLVDSVASGWRTARIPTRSRRTDTELIELIGQHWDAVGGRSSRMLRLLRDDLVIACEQKRFKELFAQVRVQREAAL